LAELSKSGQGIHLWLFFDEPVLAADARRLGDFLISRAIDEADGIDLTSFDRLFPHQDYVEEGGLGNLIALPLHYGSRRGGRTVFVDLQTMTPYPDQWGRLAELRRIGRSELEAFLDLHALRNDPEESMPWKVVHEDSVTLPKTIRGVLYDALYLEREGLNRQAVNRFKRMASFANPEFFLRQRLRKSTYNVPRVVTLFDRNERYLILPRGLKEEVEAFVSDLGSRIHWEDRRQNQGAEIPAMRVEPRPEQRQVIEELSGKEYGLLVAPPGFGKTFVAAVLVARRRVTTLVLVHKTTLLEQWRQRLAEYLALDEKAIGILGQGKNRLNGTLDVATLQSLRHRPETIENYTQVIVDEAHHIPASSYEIPLRSFRGRYLLGLSATPRRKDGMHPLMFFQCGPVAFEVSQKLHIRHTLQVRYSRFETMEESFASILNELVLCEERNRLIVETVVSHRGRRMLLLSERIEHLNTLYHLLHDRGIAVTLLHGTLGRRMQRKMKAELEAAEVLLSTSGYIGEGVDIGHLDTLILTMPISYSGRMVQYLGRIGRQGQRCLVIDIVDEKVPMLKASFRKRQSAYRKMGYAVQAERDGPALF